MARTWMAGLAGAVLVLAPAAALATVGSVSVLEGSASRAGADGKAQPLVKGMAVEVGDVLQVEKGNVEVTLTDSSVLALAEGTRLSLDEASFAGQERKAFSARLMLGSVWAKVTKALSGSEAKFEVSTERAVAGVRGTIFRVEVEGATPSGDTLVAVEEGKVAVTRRASSMAQAGAMAARIEFVNHGEAIKVHRDNIERVRFEAPRAAAFERFVKSRSRDREVHHAAPAHEDHHERRRH